MLCQWHTEVWISFYWVPHQTNSFSVSAAGKGFFIVPPETKLAILDRASTGKQIQKESKRH
jgi:hypothetical protein